VTERIARVPTLAEMTETPALIDQLPAQIAAGLVVQLAGLQARLGARLAMVEAAPAEKHDAVDVLLDVEDAAVRLGLSASTLYKRHKEPPYSALTVQNGVHRVRFSGQRIDEFLRHGPQPVALTRRRTR
jgi:hypothetical protein